MDTDPVHAYGRLLEGLESAQSQRRTLPPPLLHPVGCVPHPVLAWRKS